MGCSGSHAQNSNSTAQSHPDKKPSNTKEASTYKYELEKVKMSEEQNWKKLPDSNQKSKMPVSKSKQKYSKDSEVGSDEYCHSDIASKYNVKGGAKMASKFDGKSKMGDAKKVSKQGGDCKMPPAKASKDD